MDRQHLSADGHPTKTTPTIAKLSRQTRDHDYEYLSTSNLHRTSYGFRSSFIVAAFALISLYISIMTFPSLCTSVRNLASSSANSAFSKLTKHAAATAIPFLQVFQVYPPVLIANSGGALELTDGPINASVATLHSNTSSCEETLVVHSFAYSYGQPFIGVCYVLPPRVDGSQ